MPSGFESVSIALGLTYAGIFAYLVYLHVAQRRVRREMEMLKEAMDAARTP